VLVLGWGLTGIAAGTLVSRIFMRFFVQMWFTFRKTGIPWKSFAWNICGRAAMVFLIFTGLSVLIQQALPCQSWYWFFLQIILVIIGYLPAAFWILVPESDRRRIFSKGKEIVQKVRRRNRMTDLTR